MKKILYIGEQQAVVHELQERYGEGFTAVKNVVGFYNEIDHLDQYELVIAQQQLKGISGRDIFQRYHRILNDQRVPYFLVCNFFSKGEKARLLRQGISELANNVEDLHRIVAKLPFYQQMLEARLSRQRKMRVKEYRIPLAKRLFDILVAGMALLVLLPLLLVVIIAIRLESSGKVYYISKRVGTGYRVFDFYKLRSMYQDADQRLKDLSHLNQYKAEAEAKAKASDLPTEELPKGSSPTLIHKDGTPLSEEQFQALRKQQSAGTFLKLKDDPRVTKVGRFIRNTSIDELPQLINVLKGDMSIVGNRPLPLYEAEQLTSDDWSQRFLAPAGITGLWQVEKRGKGEMSEDERKALDNKYAQNFSVWNDIVLILKTIPALFQKENV